MATTKRRSAQTEPCFGCEGKGEQTHTVETIGAGARSVDTYTTKCFRCDGKKVQPLGTAEAYRAAHNAFWCDAKGACADEEASLEGAFHDDGQCEMCEKHHWHCGVCGKIRQVG